MNYAEQQHDPGKHAIWIGIVIVMHVLLGWALVNGLARTVIEVIKGPIETKIIEEVKPPPPPENLPPPPKFAPPPPSFVPPPEVVVVAPPTPAPTITVTPIAPPPAPVVIAPAPPAPAPAPVEPPPPRVAARPAIGNVASCAPGPEDYPMVAIREEATGITKIRFKIDAAGKLAGADIVKSAGASRAHKALDRVAVQKLSECSFRAGLDENGKAVGGTFDVEYVWKLN